MPAMIKANEFEQIVNTMEKLWDEVRNLPGEDRTRFAKLVSRRQVLELIDAYTDLLMNNIEDIVLGPKV